MISHVVTDWRETPEFYVSADTPCDIHTLLSKYILGKKSYSQSISLFSSRDVNVLQTRRKKNVLRGKIAKKYGICLNGRFFALVSSKTSLNVLFIITAIFYPTEMARNE